MHTLSCIVMPLDAEFIAIRYDLGRDLSAFGTNFVRERLVSVTIASFCQKCETNIIIKYMKVVYADKLVKLNLNTQITLSNYLSYYNGFYI